jgi:hypothetical protein
MAHPSQKRPTARRKKGSFVAKVRIAARWRRRPTADRDVAGDIPSGSTTSLAASRLKIDLEDSTMSHSVVAALRMRLPVQQVKLKSDAHWHDDLDPIACNTLR